MTDVRNCSTCIYWRAGAITDMTMAARDESYEDVGACENFAPMIYIINEGPVTLQPTTHATRCCAEWLGIWGGDDPDNDPDSAPEPEPKPDIAKVRRLFPNPPRPIAA
ncbi:hypothetical protein [Sphingobium yanoikuyae]|uniref:Uncharacterized protein n=1 Tax=Sphingobium yanoikuyae TaxID=13690 RepID=A0A0J9D171_SPHYA|nr:hypothetical protein [Sphingobium yanoikuyae]ATP20787.1 hypothetical protein BV87_22000 [Sphingobium yanoikuyae]KMW31137.1 hypothetical protein BV87_02855 [Sphingobium yanoikuyae]